ncbi:MAG: hypothetical protein WC860_03785 [Candidatus Margulisiibacteriota bacterium]|jgi:hypothetical protein
MNSERNFFNYCQDTDYYPTDQKINGIIKETEFTLFFKLNQSHIIDCKWHASVKIIGDLLDNFCAQLIGRTTNNLNQALSEELAILFPNNSNELKYLLDLLINKLE